MTRHLAIGDIHGCFTALESLVDYVGFKRDDTIVALGDYVNRGPDSCKVIDWLIRFDQSHNLVALRGNHEIMMMEAAEKPNAHREWLKYRGEATLRSYARWTKDDLDSKDRGGLANVPKSHWKFIRNRLLPYYESRTHLFVHAAVYPDMPLAEQPDYMLYWEKISDPPRHESGKIVVCGHTSQKSGLPLHNGNAICIDTWACGDGWLSCLDVQREHVWQANEKRKTRQFALTDLPT